MADVRTTLSSWRRIGQRGSGLLQWRPPRPQRSPTIPIPNEFYIIGEFCIMAGFITGAEFNTAFIVGAEGSRSGCGIESSQLVASQVSMDRSQLAISEN